MATLPKRVNITITLPVVQNVELSPDNHLQLNMHVDMSATNRFLPSLVRLCKKYGYTVGEIQENIEIPQNAIAYYLCDGKACEQCHPDRCKHTTNVAHAINFGADLNGQRANGAHATRVGFFEKDNIKITEANQNGK